MVDERDFQKIYEVVSNEKTRTTFITASADCFWKMVGIGMDSGYRRKNNEMEVRKTQSNFLRCFHRTVYKVENLAVYHCFKQNIQQGI